MSLRNHFQCLLVVCSTFLGCVGKRNKNIYPFKNFIIMTYNHDLKRAKQEKSPWAEINKKQKTGVKKAKGLSSKAVLG